MSPPLLITQFVNLICGTVITWQTFKSFHLPKQEDQLFDNLLIRWIILYLLIYIEEVTSLFDWIPLIGSIIALLPFAAKVYIILPHSQGYLKIYGILEQLELDDHTGKIMKIFQRITKYIIIKALKVVENYVDMVQSEDLNEVEMALQKINQQIIDKRTLVQVHRSQIRFKKPQHQEPVEQHSEILQQPSVFKSKIKTQHHVADANTLEIVASVLTSKASKIKEAVFTDFRMIFNQSTCQLSFFHLESNKVVFESIQNQFTQFYLDILTQIDYTNKRLRSLEFIYEHPVVNEQFSVVKLKDVEDTINWLKPVLEILINKTADYE